MMVNQMKDSSVWHYGLIVSFISSLVVMKAIWLIFEIIISLSYRSLHGGLGPHHLRFGCFFIL